MAIIVALFTLFLFVLGLIVCFVGISMARPKKSAILRRNAQVAVSYRKNVIGKVNDLPGNSGLTKAGATYNKKTKRWERARTLSNDALQDMIH